MSQAGKEAGQKRQGNSRPKRTESPTIKRTPVGEARDRLTVEGLDNSRKYRWVKDILDGQRIQTFLNAGYRFETDQTLTVGQKRTAKTDGEGSQIKEYQELDKQGKSVYSYLMSIPKEWHEEDQALKQKKIDDIEYGMTQTPEGLYTKNISVEDDGLGKKFNQAARRPLV